MEPLGGGADSEARSVAPSGDFPAERGIGACAIPDRYYITSFMYDNRAGHVNRARGQPAGEGRDETITPNDVLYLAQNREVVQPGLRQTVSVRRRNGPPRMSGAVQYT